MSIWIACLLKGIKVNYWPIKDIRDFSQGQPVQDQSWTLNAIYALFHRERPVLRFLRREPSDRSGPTQPLSERGQRGTK